MAQARKGYFPQVLPVYQHLALGRLVVPRHQVAQRGLAGTGWADKCNDLADPSTQIDIVQSPAAVGIGIADILEVNTRLDRGEFLAASEHLIRQVHDEEHATYSGNALLDAEPDVG